MVKNLSFCFSLIFLGGCALPPAITMVSLMLDGASFAHTGKGVSDHAISQIAGADCALWYGFVEGAFCNDEMMSEPIFDPGVSSIVTASGGDDSGGMGGYRILALHEETGATFAVTTSPRFTFMGGREEFTR